MKAKTWGPVLTFAVVLAVGTTAALVHDGGSERSKGPKRLALVTRSDSAAPVASGGGTGGGYRLETTLSADKPADQQAFDLTRGAVDGDTVRRLADALHAGVPVRTGDDWHAGGLSVSGRPGQTWSWSSCAPPTPVTVTPLPPDSATAGSGCAVSSGTSGTTPPDMPTSEVKDAVRAVLAAVAIDVDTARIEGNPYGGSATWGPEGVSGLDTQVSVDRSGAVISASGWLGRRVPADTYPVVSAKDAYADLPALAYPEICRLAPGGKGCLPPDPVEIVGATLGLSVQTTTDGDAMLVPSWLFQTKAAGVIAVIAVEKQYRQTPPPPSDLPASVEPSSVGGSGGGSGGGSAPANPGSVEPAPPAPQVKPTS